AFLASGIQATSEYSISHGRIDIVLHLPSKIYVCEVKFNTTAEDALTQIEERRYYEPFLSSNKLVVLLGLCFHKEPHDFYITYTAKEIKHA
ncbi:MAG: hypothetical protein FJZ58_00215, partial [Chlamydiae bacterium]|nr:hypothetical protein [Chlamydiota bacterium]